MKVGRNDPCSCGSGKKYKHCCLRKKSEQRERVQNSLVRGLFLAAIPLALVGIAAAVIAAYRGNSSTGEGPPRVWSAEHGHWHVLNPDGTETEYRPGLVWSPEHGHWHEAEPIEEGVSRHAEKHLEHHLNELEGQASE